VEAVAGRLDGGGPVPGRARDTGGRGGQAGPDALRALGRVRCGLTRPRRPPGPGGRVGGGRVGGGRVGGGRVGGGRVRGRAGGRARGGRARGRVGGRVQRGVAAHAGRRARRIQGRTRRT